MRLNLGCSDAHLDQWLNVDRVPPADQIVELNEWKWPWENSSIEEIRAIDCFEHLENRIAVMNEAHRILIPGGHLTLECPNASKGSGAFQDPTHVSFWCPNSLQYYEDGQGARERFGAAYGITARFKVLSCREWSYQYPVQDREIVWKFSAVLEAVK